MYIHSESVYLLLNFLYTLFVQYLVKITEIKYVLIRSNLMRINLKRREGYTYVTIVNKRSLRVFIMSN